MNKHCIRAAAWLLIGILCFSGISFAIPATAGAAAEPSLNYSKKTIIIGTTYTLQVQNVTDSKASYSWSTSDSSVATVNGKGKVTPKKEGTANITCRITYLDRSTKSLTCVVTAKERVEAENVAINNAKTEDLNAHDVYDLSVTVFEQDEAYRPMPVFYFFTRATRKELTDQTTFPLKIMATLRESKEFRDVCRDCYLKTVQPLETWSPHAPYFF